MESYYFNDTEIGLDEAGRGPLIGRVYAGAVIWNANNTNDIITDSKKLSKKKRKEALKWIKTNVKAWGVGYADVNEIDNINILNATKLAMDRAIDNLKSNYNITTNYLIVDGIGWENKFVDYNIKSIVKGDSKYLSIASASIIAKEYHDEYIISLCKENPELNMKYDLENNMGYGTKKHLLGLEKYGNSIYHRKTFKPCCNYINQ